MAVIFQSAVTHAATVGARESGKEPSITVVVNAVQSILDANCITLETTDGSGTKVVLEDGMRPTACTAIRQ